MAAYRSRGIVLRSIRYGEADRILDLYTSDAGLISAIAKGVRRTKSHFGARLEPFSCVEFLAYRGRSLETLTQAETLRSFRAIREDLPRFECAARIAGYARALSGGDEADRRVFNLLFHTLSALEERSSGFAPLEAAFGMKLSILAGYAPQLGECAVCGEEVEASGMIRFAPDLGGVTCAECSVASRDSFAVPPEVQGLLLDAARLPVRESPLEDRYGEALRKVTRAHITANSPSGSVSGFAGQSRSPA